MFDPFTLNELIREHGRVLTLTKKTTPNYNSITGSVTTVNVTYTVLGQFYNDVPEQTENTPNTFGTKRAVISNVMVNGSPTPMPSVQDTISFSGGKSTAITKVSPIVSNSSVMCYLLHLDE